LGSTYRCHPGRLCAERWRFQRRPAHLSHATPSRP